MAASCMLPAAWPSVRSAAWPRTAALTPLGHVATTDDVARAIAMYCSDDVGFVTGTYLPVNGGASMD